MKLIRGLQNLSPTPRDCVLAIGNFDGVHRGHQALLNRLRLTAHQYKLPLLVMIFEPQPQELFAGDNAPARLTRLREKLTYLAQYGVDSVLCVHFTRQFAAMTAQQFIHELLIKKLAVKFLYVGDDFRFGAGRKGNFTLLQQAGRELGMHVRQSPTFCDDNMRISSTAIRQALKENNLPLAERLLGHPFIICGRVAHGDELGRTLGFPTANLPLHRQVCPIQGVFAVEVSGPGFQQLPGVANIGTRPTIAGKNQQLEVHLLDITLDLYGQHLQVTLRHKLRDEQRFTSLEALTAQITLDAAAARHYFSHATTTPAPTFFSPLHHHSEYGIPSNE